jgi:hypothetical protein
MNTTISMLYKFMAVTVMALFLAACGGSGGGSGGGGAISSGTGSVGVVLTDKPAELSEIEEILLSITGVEFFREDDGRKVTLYEGPARGPFDLLKLEEESRLLIFGDKIPVGSYCKIRLTLSDLELVFNTGEPNFHPKLPGNKKLDLNARDCFHVRRGDTMYLQLDMDAKSIHIVETKKGTSYNFRPVVFIDVINKNFPSKLVRLEEGVIRSINREEGTLLLCDFSYGERATGGLDDCVTVRIKDTAAFDNIEDDGINRTSDGDAIPLNELLIEERVGTRPVTVVGLFNNGDDEVEHHNSDDSRYPVMNGLVVELGGFLTLHGRVANDARDMRFNMELAPDQGISVDGVLPVALQPTDPPVNGTRIMNLHGDPLETSDIIVPRPTIVDGVLRVQIGEEPDYYNSALVILHRLVVTDDDVARGIIAEEPGLGGLRLSADSFPCEEGTGIFDVTFDSRTFVYLSSSTGGRWGDTGDLSRGQDVDIRGVCEGTSLAADVIIIRED